MQDFSSYLQVHSGPCRCPFRSVPVSIPVHSRIHSGPFQCPFGSVPVSIPVRSGPFLSIPLSIPVRSGPFHCPFGSVPVSIPVRSGPFRSVPVHSCISMHPLKTCSRLWCIMSTPSRRRGGDMIRQSREQVSNSPST